MSTDHYQTVLKPYIDDKIVTLIDWPIPQGQVSAAQNWYDNYRDETQWVSFLDMDEFICPKFDVSLKEWIKKYVKYPSVLMYWRMFGTSGLLEHDTSKLVIEQYHNCWSELYQVGKQFYNTDYDVHRFDRNFMHLLNIQVTTLGRKIIIPPVNELGFFIKWDIHLFKKRAFRKSRIQVNHYWCKAWNVYQGKIKRGDAVFVQNPRDMEYFLYHEHRAKSVDYTIYRYLLQLRLRMFSHEL